MCDTIIMSSWSVKQYFYVSYLLYNMNLNLSNFTLSKAKLYIYSTYIYIFALIFQSACNFCAISLHLQPLMIW
jgi:hypothetical protein